MCRKETLALLFLPVEPDLKLDIRIQAGASFSLIVCVLGLHCQEGTVVRYMTEPALNPAARTFLTTSFSSLDKPPISRWKPS